MIMVKNSVEHISSLPILPTSLTPSGSMGSGETILAGVDEAVEVAETRRTIQLAIILLYEQQQRFLVLDESFMQHLNVPLIFFFLNLKHVYQKMVNNQDLEWISPSITQRLIYILSSKNLAIKSKSLLQSRFKVTLVQRIFIRMKHKIVILNF